MLDQLKTRKNLKALTAALACGLVFTMGGQAEAELLELYGAGTEPTKGSAQLNGVDSEGNVVTNAVTAEDDTYVSKSKTNVFSSSNFTVAGGTWFSAFGGYSEGSGVVTSNEVTITGDSKTNLVYGGYANSNDIEAVTYNKVTISGGETNRVHGGYVNSNYKGAVTYNTVIVTSGTVNNSVYGGFTNSKSELAVTTGDVTGNTVTISGGTVNASVYGGYADKRRTGAVTGNTVTLGDKNGLGVAQITGTVGINKKIRELCVRRHLECL